MGYWSQIVQIIYSYHVSLIPRLSPGLFILSEKIIFIIKHWISVQRVKNISYDLLKYLDIFFNEPWVLLSAPVFEDANYEGNFNDSNIMFTSVRVILDSEVVWILWLSPRVSYIYKVSPKCKHILNNYKGRLHCQNVTESTAISC